MQENEIKHTMLKRLLCALLSISRINYSRLRENYRQSHVIIHLLELKIIEKSERDIEGAAEVSWCWREKFRFLCSAPYRYECWDIDTSTWNKEVWMEYEIWVEGKWLRYLGMFGIWVCILCVCVTDLVPELDSSLKRSCRDFTLCKHPPHKK